MYVSSEPIRGRRDFNQAAADPIRVSINSNDRSSRVTADVGESNIPSVGRRREGAVNVGMCMTLAFEIIVACLYKAGTQAAVLNICRPVAPQGGYIVQQCAANVAHGSWQRQSPLTAYGRLSNIKLTGWYIMICGGRWPGE
jgi:hypothetical protein